MQSIKSTTLVKKTGTETSNLLSKVQDKLESVITEAKSASMTLKTQAVTIIKNPQFQTITICTAGGTVTLGAAGGAFGLATGMATGTAVGLVPALFTFGMSIPAGAVVGGGIGLCGGIATGSTAGALGGGAAGYGVYKYRVEIQDGVIYVKKRAKASVDGTKLRIHDMIALAKTKGAEFDKCIKEYMTTTSHNIVTFTKRTAGKISAAPKDPAFQVTAASSTAGAVAGGTVGAATGGTIGAAIGVVPALFTFGLSIPVGAVIGGGLGMCAGSTTGAVSGGAAGYYGYKYRGEIKSIASEWKTKAFDKANQVKCKALDSASQVSKSLGFGGTGGTA